MDKHTPGPWRFERGDPFDHSNNGEENGFTIFLGDSSLCIEQIRYCEDIYPEDVQDHQTGEANARLIAAAPELLDLLCMALPYIECAIDDPAYKPAPVKKLVQEIRDLLSKAGG